MLGRFVHILILRCTVELNRWRYLHSFAKMLPKINRFPRIVLFTCALAQKYCLSLIERPGNAASITSSNAHFMATRIASNVNVRQVTQRTSRSASPVELLSVCRYGVKLCELAFRALSQVRAARDAFVTETGAGVAASSLCTTFAVDPAGFSSVGRSKQCC